MIQKRATIFGLDIGNRYLKTFQLKDSSDLTGQGFLHPSEKFDQLEARLEYAGNYINQYRNSFPKNFRITPSLSVQDVIVRTIRIPKATDSEVANLLTWELSETVEFTPKTHQLRYVYIGEMKERQGYRDEYIVVLVSNEVVEKYIDFFDHYQIIAGGLDFDGFALTRFLKTYLKNQEMEDNIIGLLDIGYHQSTFLILRHGKLAFIKNIQFGTKNIDLQLASLLSKTMEDTITWREELGHQIELTEDIKGFLNQALPNIVDPFEKMINSCLRYYSGNFRGEYVDTIFLTGGSANLYGLTNAMKNATGQNFERPTSPNSSIDFTLWAKAIGISLKKAVPI